MAKEIKFNIRLNIDGKEQIGVVTADVVKLRSAMESSKTSAQQFRDKLFAINQAVTMLQNASGAIAGLRDTMSGLTASYNAVQQANTQLTTVMRQRMAATDEDIKKVTAVIGAQSKLGIIGGTVQKTGAQQIATFLKEKGTLEQLIPAMNDLLAQQRGLNASQEDARSVANLMGKAMTGQTSALKRVGITFTDAQKKVMEYGTEQQRASMLAQIITDNVGHMNAQLGKTDAGKLKQVEMRFASIKVQLGELVSNVLPYVTVAAQTLTIANSVITLGKSIQGVVAAIKSFNVLSGTMSVVCAGAKIAMVGLSAVTKAAQAAFTGATIGATTLKIAIKSLLISTGVGVAIWALTEAISYFVTSTDKAKASTEQLTAAEESAQALKQQEAKQIAEVSAALDINIAKLKEFKGSKEEEKKLVGEMNSTYGEAMGYYSTVAQWYTALTGNSKAYCNQMVNEIRLRNLASQAADLQQQQHNIRYDDNGKLKKYSKRRETRRVATGQIDAGDGKVLPQYSEVEVKGTSDLEKANARLSALGKQEQALRKQMGDIVKGSGASTFNHYAGYSPSAPSETVKAPKVKTSGGKGSGSADTERKAAEGSLDWYEQEMQKLRKQIYATNNEQTAQGLQAQYDDLEQKSKSLKVSIGLEDPDAKEVKTYVEPSYMVKGSVADKRQSYSNAQSKGSTVQSDFEIGIIGKDEAERQIAEINKEIAALGANMKPIKLQVDDKLDVA